jgi:hypothetical protein
VQKQKSNVRTGNGPRVGVLADADHCYARKIARRFAGEIHRQNKEIPENTIRDLCRLNMESSQREDNQMSAAYSSTA